MIYCGIGQKITFRRRASVVFFFLTPNFREAVFFFPVVPEESGSEFLENRRNLTFGRRAGATFFFFLTPNFPGPGFVFVLTNFSRKSFFF